MTAKAFEQAKDGSPIWNETLEFSINPASNEILFEVYDDDFPLSGAINNTKLEKPINDQEKRFLGLAIVGLDELKTGGIHQLKLQGKPYGNANSAEKVSGSIVVECRFLHIASSLPRQPNSLTTPSMRPNPTHNQPGFPVSSLDNRQKGSLTNFQPNYLYNIGGAGDESLNQSPSPPPPLKSTSVLITNPGQAQQSPRRHQQFSYGPQGYGFGDFDDLERIGQGSPNSNQQFEELNLANSYDRQISPSTNSQQSQLHQQVNNFHTQPTRDNIMADELYNPYVIDRRQQQQYSLERAAKQPRMVNERPNTSRSYDEYTAQNVLTYDQQKEPLVIDTGTIVPVNSPQSPEPPPVPPHAQQTESALEETARRARDREPKKPQSKHRERSFFEELRQRLTRGSSKLGRKRAKSLDQQNPELEEAVSVPPSRDQSQTRYPTGQKESIPHHHEVSSTGGSERGPTSPSSASTSQLILELDDSSSPETGGKRYYLIPGVIANEPAAIRLMRSGKKLHVHNNHAFVAVKPRGRVMCNICGRNIAGNFTKQAYQCRDCRKVSHKSCHQRSSSPCHNSNLANLNIIEDVDWVDFLRQYQFEEFISVNGV
ncbi:phorbol esters/diacylglycerol binding domain (C1 domain) domain-containing protein [Ditylenchus destructor]|uniref:Phorbol esters/diacylglycerol binding domain (C1 domain) domain-containing protein n=1 Tax=Ditylenchus destructor TaxID=166010 RepID=A0AAD4NCS4_9BILA|nr:phorbol esters/diacylglycerol binding domain (C1 domain) domain-containing protein [Ditylenchus destructor]